MKLELYEPSGFDREVEKIVRDLADNDYGQFTPEAVEAMIEKWIESVVDACLSDAHWYLFRNPHRYPSDKAFWDLVEDREGELPEPPDVDDNMPGNEADAQTLAMAGWGTDEDYFHGPDEY